MARYLSVEETAEILGMTDRTVRRMLNAGRLSGSQHQDKGKLVWRVNATKDLLEKLERKYQQSPLSVDSPVYYTEAAQTAEAEIVDFEPSVRSEVKVLADELIRPLIERLEAQAMILSEKERVIADQARQLRLLPDFEKMASNEREAAEKERMAAEAKALEVEALRKQIEALQSEKEAAEAHVQKAAEVFDELASLKSEIGELKRPFWKKLFGGK